MSLIPPRLKKGDRIGVVSPSRAVMPELAGQFANGVKYLQGLGFEVVQGRNVFSSSWGYSASPEEKAEDINAMFADDSVRAVICSQGGANSNACLPYLDWELIRTHPKVFLGISDITVLLNAIHQQTGLVTYHGNDVVWGFGRVPTDYDRQEFISILVEGRSGKITPRGLRKTVRGGAAEGKLLGGNLPCLLKLAGTPYFPDFSEAIFFVEAIDISPEGCDQAFHQLKQIGFFERIRGAVVGYIDGLQNIENAPVQMEELLLHVSAGREFPILKVDDFGHNCPNTVLPVGGRLRLDADEHSLELLQACVL